MNHLKEAFDERFQELKRSDLKVKQSVRNAVLERSESLPKRKIPVMLTSLVALFAIVIVAVLATQFTKPVQQKAIIDEQYFDMLLYENYELSSYFNTEAQAKNLLYEVYINDLAAIDYVESEGLTIYEERIDAFYKDQQQVITDILKEQPDNWLHFHLAKLEERFGITTEDYLFYQRNEQIKAHVAREMMAGLVADELNSTQNEYDQIDKIALERFEEKYSEQLAAFREKYDIDLTYDITRKGQSTTMVYDGQSYDTVIIDGKKVFKDIYASTDQLQNQFAHVIKEIESNEDLTLLCYLTLEDYKRGAEKLFNDEQLGNEALMFDDLLGILRNSIEID